MFQFRWVLIFVTTLSCAGPASADVVLTLYNTGVDDNHNPLAGGAVDPHYSLVQSADSSFPGPDARVVSDGYPLVPVGQWLANDSLSKWISPRSDGGNNIGGTYVYRTTFDLTGYIPGSAQINGQWTLDDFGTDILINGNSTGISRNDQNAYQSWAALTINSGFLPGINTLDFIIQNYPGSIPQNPTGLRTELMLNATPVPEPSSLLLLLTVAGPCTFRLTMRIRLGTRTAHGDIT